MFVAKGINEWLAPAVRNPSSGFRRCVGLSLSGPVTLLDRPARRGRLIDWAPFPSARRFHDKDETRCGAKRSARLYERSADIHCMTTCENFDIFCLSAERGIE
jgi:hypothetical protein